MSELFKNTKGCQYCDNNEEKEMDYWTEGYVVCKKCEKRTFMASWYIQMNKTIKII